MCRKSVEEIVSESVAEQLFCGAEKEHGASITSSFCSMAPAALSGLLPLKMIAYLPLLRHQNIPSRISIHPSISSCKIAPFQQKRGDHSDFLLFFCRLSSPRRWKKYARLIGGWVGCYRQLGLHRQQNEPMLLYNELRRRFLLQRLTTSSPPMPSCRPETIKNITGQFSLFAA